MGGSGCPWCSILNGYREDLLEELGAIWGLWEGPWCVGGI